MSDQANALALGGAFVDDAAARASFLAVQRRLLWRKRLLPLAAILALLLVWWQSIEIFGIRPFIAPSPVAVGHVLFARFDMLMANLLPTAIEAVLGFLLGNFAGIAIATAFVYSRTMEEAFFPIAVMVNTIPVVAKAPILVLLPYLFAALKIAASTAVIGAIVGEWIGSTTGIGALIISATYNFDSPLLYATIVVGSTFAALFFGVITLVERRILKWHVTRQP